MVDAVAASAEFEKARRQQVRDLVRGMRQTMMPEVRDAVAFGGLVPPIDPEWEAAHPGGTTDGPINSLTPSIIGYSLQGAAWGAVAGATLRGAGLGVEWGAGKLAGRAASGAGSEVVGQTTGQIARQAMQVARQAARDKFLPVPVNPRTGGGWAAPRPYVEPSGVSRAAHWTVGPHPRMREWAHSTWNTTKEVSAAIDKGFMKMGHAFFAAEPAVNRAMGLTARQQATGFVGAMLSGALIGAGIGAIVGAVKSSYADSSAEGEANTRKLMAGSASPEALADERAMAHYLFNKDNGVYTTYTSIKSMSNPPQHLYDAMTNAEARVEQAIGAPSLDRFIERGYEAFRAAGGAAGKSEKDAVAEFGALPPVTQIGFGAMALRRETPAEMHVYESGVGM